jgi:hypothetical protein
MVADMSNQGSLPPEPDVVVDDEDVVAEAPPPPRPEPDRSVNSS